MHKLYELKDRLCDELCEYADGELNAQTLEAIDKLAHATKNLEKVIVMCENDGSYRRTRRDKMATYSKEDYARDLRDMEQYLPAERREDMERIISHMVW